MGITNPPVPTSPGDFVQVILEASGHHRPVEKTDLSAQGPAGAVNASRQVLAGDVCELIGWSIRETTGAAAAAVRIHDGNSANNELIATIALPSAGSSQLYTTGRGIHITTGRLFLAVVAGSVEGVLYWR